MNELGGVAVDSEDIRCAFDHFADVNTKSALEKEEIEAMLALVSSAFPEEKREHRADVKALLGGSRDGSMSLARMEAGPDTSSLVPCHLNLAAFGTPAHHEQTVKLSCLCLGTGAGTSFLVSAT